ncbi:MAG: 3-dehydroquinate synthase [Actinomycetaceae bacterium]|nr:3-dehydroquinate synthase [Actinomycetaceae bacterium]
MQPQEIRIELKREIDESYPIIIGRDLADKVLEIANQEHLKNRRIALITDSNVARIAGDEMISALAASGRQGQAFTFPAGEEYKTREVKEHLENYMIDAGYGRDTLIIAFGGGVVTDLAGFIASTFTRGVPYISVPTTLVGAADASVGGKTAVNTPTATNLIGAFHQPQAVVIDLNRWLTLKDEHILDGLGETIKQACIADKEFFELLEDAFVNRGLSPLDFVRDEEIVSVVARKNCEIKRDFVMSDVHEGNRRMGLNLGHTIGRALEAAMDYKMTHGACVAVGLNLQARWGVQFGYITAEDASRVENVLKNAGLPTELPENVAVEKIMESMRHDKKAESGNIRFVFQKGIGGLMTFDDGMYARNVSEEEIIAFLNSQK